MMSLARLDRMGRLLRLPPLAEETNGGSLELQL